MKKRIEIMDIVLIVVVCSITILLSFLIFSKLENGVTYMIAIIINLLYGVFKEVCDFYLESKERDLNTKLKELCLSLSLYAVIIILITLFFNYTGIVSLILLVFTAIIPLFIGNMVVFLVAKKR